MGYLYLFTSKVREGKGEERGRRGGMPHICGGV